MASIDLPLPSLMSLIAVAIELGVGLAIALGFYTRPLALLLGIYTLIAAIIGHPYWHISGELQYESMINFYTNISIARGLLLLVLTGQVAYSLDRKWRRDESLIGTLRVLIPRSRSLSDPCWCS